MIKTPDTGAVMNVRGNLVVIVIVIVMGIAAVVTVLFKPKPMSSIEVARQKQLLVYESVDSTQVEQLAILSQDKLDAYIGVLNYILRMRDSLTVMSQTGVAVGDAEYTLEEANQKLAITALAQREAAARAKAMQIIGANLTAAVDSLYELAHQPMPVFPQDSTLIRERNLTFERYSARIFE